MTNRLLNPDYIFESSWEVCNKVGGIYTVLSTRAKTLQEAHQDKVIFIGPGLWKREDGNYTKEESPYFREDPSLFADWQWEAKENGLQVRVGRWTVPGEPIAILVDFNYRLNLYGFMNLNCLSPRFDMNCGLYDQIKALEFIHTNIAAFGGDPGNVTLFGQSSGAACILALMTMPEAEPLFAKSIVQSACVDSFWSTEQSQKLTKMYFRMIGLSTKKPEKIMSADPVKVYRANRKIKIRVRAGGEVTCVFSPVIDGKTYYFKEGSGSYPTGAAYTGWKTVNGKLYFFANSSYTKLHEGAHISDMCADVNEFELVFAPDDLFLHVLTIWT